MHDDEQSARENRIKRMMNMRTIMGGESVRLIRILECGRDRVVQYIPIMNLNIFLYSDNFSFISQINFIDYNFSFVIEQ